MNECPYCTYIDGSNSNEELPGYDDSSYGEELYARVSGTNGRHPRIDVFQDGTNAALFIDINFCPICGRNLRKVVDE